MTTYDDEIDLRPYIDAVLKSWWKIGLLAFAFAILVFIYIMLQAQSYKAKSTILVPRSQLQLSLADQFPTILDQGDASSKMEAYLAIAQSDAIALQTYTALQDSFPEGYRVKNLQQNVEIKDTGDAILVTATGPTPQLAADIANQWATNTVQAINLAYSGEQPLEVIKTQIDSAAMKYQETQQALETFIETNSLTDLQATLDIAQKALNSYINDQTWQIDYLHQQRQQYIQFIEQAEFIKNQVENGSASQPGDVGDALAVINARGRKFNFYNSSSIENLPSSNTPNDLIIQLNDPTILLDSPANYAQDIDTIIQLSEQDLQQISQDIESHVIGSYQDVEEPYSSLASDIQNLKAQLENLKALERELSSDRDLAWETYQTLLQKETEIQTTAQTSAVVNFASPAIPPGEPEARQTLMKTAIAGILGGMIGIFLVVIRLWWKSSQISDSDNTKVLS